MNEQDKEYLRDLFAGFSVCGLIISGKHAVEEIPFMAYKMADSMIEFKDFKDIGIKGVRKKKSIKQG